MAYIGNIPAESYASFLTETFTVSATASYTLSHAVTNENDIRLVINGVVQQPGSGKAYTASGTTLTLTSATVSGDVMYAVYLGRALQTVNPPNASVGTAQLGSDAVTGAKIADDAISDEHLDPTIITGQTAETSIATDDLILLSDTSASGALKKMTRANFVSGVGGDNKPYFAATAASQSSLADNTWVKVNFTGEVVDSDGKYDASNSRFTPTVAGWYQCNVRVLLYNASDDMRSESNIAFYKNGGNNGNNNSNSYRNGGGLFYFVTPHKQSIIYLDTDDYLEAYVRPNAADGSTATDGSACMFSAFKLI